MVVYVTAYARAAWLFFVRWLMRITFGLAPELVLAERRELVAARTEIDRLTLRLAEESEIGTRAATKALELAKANARLRKEVDDLVDLTFELKEERDALRAQVAREQVLS